MTASWETVRVFISSTFHDMHAERDHLVRFVFPRLREQLLPLRIDLLDVDLRWGITSELVAFEVCREIIDECRPRFLCMLGGRYGSVPPGNVRSITADEVHYGVLDRSVNERGLAFFYFRDQATTAAMVERVPGELREPPGSDKQQKLIELKQAIVAAELKPFVYHARWDNERRRLVGLREFGDRVAQDLLASVESDPSLRDRFSTGSQQRDEFADEIAAMDIFIEKRAETFVLGSREAVLDQLLTHITGKRGNGYLCLTGVPGSGKSALLAHLSRRRELRADPSTICIYHFVGATPNSTDVRRTARRLCYELKARCREITAPIPDDPERLFVAFQEFLHQASARRRVVILLDAVNQFDPISHLIGLRWLPEELPENARVILSALEGSALDELRRRRRPHEVELKPLTINDGKAIIDHFQQRYRKNFERHQRAALLAKSDAGLPLYLLAALEELRTLGTYEEITERITSLPATTSELFDWILERLENDDGFRDRYERHNGRQLVPRFALMLGASRHGLTQTELMKLLAPADVASDSDATPDPQGNVAMLLRLIRPYLMRRYEMIDFYHSQFREAAVRRHLQSESAKEKTHKELSQYFLNWATQAHGEQASLPTYQLKLTCNLEVELTKRLLGGMLKKVVGRGTEPSKVIMRFHEELIDALGIGSEEGLVVMQSFQETGTAVSSPLTNAEADAVIPRLKRLGISTELDAGPVRLPLRWTSTESRPYSELLYHQRQAHLWQDQAELLVDDTFNSRCRELLGPAAFVEGVREFVKSAGQDSRGQSALTHLRLNLPLNEFTNALLPMVAQGLEHSVAEVVSLLAECVKRPDQQARAVMGLRTMVKREMVRVNRRPAAEQRELSELARSFLKSTDTRVRWEAVHAYRSISPSARFEPLLDLAINESEHPLVRAEAARQLGLTDETSVVEPLLRLASSQHFPLNMMAERSAHLIQQSNRLVSARPVDDWAQPKQLPVDLPATLQTFGIDISAVDWSLRTPEQPLLIHIVRPSELSLEANWKEAELVWHSLGKLPCHLVCSESGTRDNSLTPLKSIASMEIWQDVALRYFHDFKLCSEEYLQLATNYRFQIQGIDDGEMFRLAMAQIREGRRALELVASVRRAQTMLSQTLNQMSGTKSLAAVLITSALPGYQIARLLGEQRQFHRLQGDTLSMSGSLGEDGMLESMLPETVPAHLVRPPAGFTYLCLNMREPRNAVFDLDVNYIHSVNS